MPVTRRTAPGHRAGRCRASVARAGHRPAARRPVRCSRIPPAPAPSAAAPSRARSRGATTCCSPTTSAGCGRSPASPGRLAGRHRARAGRPRRTVHLGARHGQPARRRSMVGVDVAEDGGCATACSTASGRSPLPGSARRASPRWRWRPTPRWYATTAAWCDARVRGDRQPDCLAIARAERANIDARSPGAPRTTRSSACGSPTGSAGPGWSSVKDRGRRAGPPGSVAVHARPGARVGALLAGWLEASAGNVDRAEVDLESAREIAEELGDEVLRADTQRHLAFLRIQQGRPRDVLGCAAASLETSRSLARRGRPRGPDPGRLWLAHARRHRGRRRDAAEAMQLLTPIGDSWALVHAGALLGGIAQAEHRFDDAVEASPAPRRSPSASAFPDRQRCTWPASPAPSNEPATPMRPPDPSTGPSPPRPRAVTAGWRRRRGSTSPGSGGPTVTIRAPAASSRRTPGGTDAAGGGGRALNRCLPSAEAGDDAALERLLDEAGAAGNREVEVYALDALARIAANGETERAHGSCWTRRSRWQRPSSTSSTTTTVRPVASRAPDGRAPRRRLSTAARWAPVPGGPCGPPGTGV